MYSVPAFQPWLVSKRLVMLPKVLIYLKDFKLCSSWSNYFTFDFLERSKSLVSELTYEIVIKNTTLIMYYRLITGRTVRFIFIYYGYINKYSKY